MGTWLYRTNINPECDPDWGSKSQYSNSIFKVIVEPSRNPKHQSGKKKTKIPDWMFYLILPSEDEKTDQLALAQNACENILDHGDHYTVGELGQKDIEEFHNAIPILIYQPGARGEFIWIVPPEPLKH